jgi:hypothetical protein
MLLSAKNANRNLKQGLPLRPNIVREDANQDITQEELGKKSDIKKKEFVLNVVNHSVRINGIKLFTVPVVVRRKGNQYKELVYDINVENSHEFFANGILVHNCDYLLTEAFKNYYDI